MMTKEELLKWCEDRATMKAQTSCTATKEKFWHYVKYENGDTYEHTEERAGSIWEDHVITKINGEIVADYIAER